MTGLFWPPSHCTKAGRQGLLIIYFLSLSFNINHICLVFTVSIAVLSTSYAFSHFTSLLPYKMGIIITTSVQCTNEETEVARNLQRKDKCKPIQKLFTATISLVHRTAIWRANISFLTPQEANLIRKGVKKLQMPRGPGPRRKAVSGRPEHRGVALLLRPTVGGQLSVPRNGKPRIYLGLNFASIQNQIRRYRSPELWGPDRCVLQQVGAAHSPRPRS